MVKLAYVFALLFTLINVARFGRGDQRLAFAIMVVGSFASIPATRMDWEIANALPLIMIDAAVAAGLLWIALTSESFWPLWATSFQLATVAMSVAKALEPRIDTYIYASVEFFWAYPVLVAINAGSFGRCGRRPPLC